MKILDTKLDKRINATNILLEMTYAEYIAISAKILHKNELQRNRIKSSGNVYSLLKKDLKEGCLIPPIVMAITSTIQSGHLEHLLKKENDQQLVQYINDKIDELVILDGLQRTYTIRDLSNELIDAEREDFESKTIRVEVYLGINKIGILYRMLTLNTGQTPMSLRHQVEIMYSNYLDTDIDGIRLIKEVEQTGIKNPHEYHFKEIIEGFNSYIERNYLPIDRDTLLDNIKSLEKLANETQGPDLFKEYLIAYDKFITVIIYKSENWVMTDEFKEQIQFTSPPFGKDINKLFNRNQVMTGFGAALGNLIDLKDYQNIHEITEILPDIFFSDIDFTLYNYLLKMEEIRRNAKKIGNDQRLFFYQFFKSLLMKETENYLDINLSIDKAYQQYLRLTT